GSGIWYGRATGGRACIGFPRPQDALRGKSRRLSPVGQRRVSPAATRLLSCPAADLPLTDRSDPRVVRAGTTSLPARDLPQLRRQRDRALPHGSELRGCRRWRRASASQNPALAPPRCRCAPPAKSQDRSEPCRSLAALLFPARHALRCCLSSRPALLRAVEPSHIELQAGHHRQPFPDKRPLPYIHAAPACGQLPSARS